MQRREVGEKENRENKMQYLERWEVYRQQKKEDDKIKRSIKKREDISKTFQVMFWLK